MKSIEEFQTCANVYRELLADAGVEPKLATRFALTAAQRETGRLKGMDIYAILDEAPLPSASDGLRAGDLLNELGIEKEDLKNLYHFMLESGIPCPKCFNPSSTINYLLAWKGYLKDKKEGAGKHPDWALTDEGKKFAATNVVIARSGTPRNHLQITWSRDVLDPLRKAVDYFLAEIKKGGEPQ